MNLPKFEPIEWRPAGHIISRPEAAQKKVNEMAPIKAEPAPAAQPPRRPLRPAKGRLLELENMFLFSCKSHRQQQHKEPIIRLFDQYKRCQPTEANMNELQQMIQG
jgi:hypothetical protein